MCNLYSMTKTQDALRSLFRIEHDRAGNLPPLPSILPDAPAPLVRVDHDRARAFSPSYS
jgi:putative SOS response-associated peptidase YedK